MAGPVDPVGDFLEIGRFAVADDAFALVGLHKRLDRLPQLLGVLLRQGFGIRNAAGDQDLRIVTAQLGNTAGQSRVLFALL